MLGVVIRSCPSSTLYQISLKRFFTSSGTYAIRVMRYKVGFPIMRDSRVWDIILIIGNLGFSYLGILRSGAFPFLATTSRIRESNTLRFGNSYIWNFPNSATAFSFRRIQFSRNWELRQFTAKRICFLSKPHIMSLPYLVRQPTQIT